MLEEEEGEHTLVIFHSSLKGIKDTPVEWTSQDNFKSSRDRRILSSISDLV